jgi:hypothetical protein
MERRKCRGGYLLASKSGGSCQKRYIEGRVNTSDQTEGLLGIFGNRWCLPVASSALRARSWEPGPVGSSWEQNSLSPPERLLPWTVVQVGQTHMSQRRYSRAWVDISVLSRLPALCDPGQAGKGRGQARMSVCDAISGVDAMLKCACAAASKGDDLEEAQECDDLVEGSGVAKTAISGTSSGRSHLVCRRRRGTLKEGNHAAERTRKMGRTPLLFTWLGDFTRFRVQWTRCGKGPPAVPDASAVPLPTRPPSVA